MLTDHQISNSRPDAFQPCPMVVHIGASKTASTTLQRNVFSRLPQIVFLGKPFARERGADDVMSEAESGLLQQVVLQIERSPPDQDIHGNLASVRRIIDRLRQTAVGAIVFSDERFSNDKHAPHEVVANRLHATFGPAEVLLSIRSQFTALPSLYLHEMRTSAEPIAFSDWLHHALADPSARDRSGETIAQFRYDNLFAAFSRVFAGRVHVLLYEDLVLDSA
ncbi:MAG TPA: hypothetical protein VFL51_04040, partial [Pseudolabrys sp.]|nr:hypothetical protein [Pseudolabrys sp.]